MERASCGLSQSIINVSKIDQLAHIRTPAFSQIGAAPVNGDRLVNAVQVQQKSGARIERPIHLFVRVSIGRSRARIAGDARKRRIDDGKSLSKALIVGQSIRQIDGALQHIGCSRGFRPSVRKRARRSRVDIESGPIDGKDRIKPPVDPHLNNRIGVCDSASHDARLRKVALLNEQERKVAPRGARVQQHIGRMPVRI
jgi:hypothetical protein